jgi:cbb3-type cytochrome oxidase maturation protein
MSVILILISASLLVAGGFLAAFLWSVHKGQYDDVETPAMRILFDDKPTASSLDKSKKLHTTNKEV